MAKLEPKKQPSSGDVILRRTLDKLKLKTGLDSVRPKPELTALGNSSSFVQFAVRYNNHSNFNNLSVQRQIGSISNRLLDYQRLGRYTTSSGLFSPMGRIYRRLQRQLNPATAKSKNHLSILETPTENFTQDDFWDSEDFNQDYLPSTEQFAPSEEFPLVADNAKPLRRAVYSDLVDTTLGDFRPPILESLSDAGLGWEKTEEPELSRSLPLQDIPMLHRANQKNPPEQTPSRAALTNQVSAVERTELNPNYPTPQNLGMGRAELSPTPPISQVSAVERTELNPNQITYSAPQDLGGKRTELIQEQDKSQPNPISAIGKSDVAPNQITYSAPQDLGMEKIEREFTSPANPISAIGKSDVAPNQITYSAPQDLGMEKIEREFTSPANPISAISGAELNPTQDTPPTPETYSARVATPSRPLVRAMERAEEGYFPSSSKPGLTTSDSPLTALARMLAEENKYTLYRNDLPLSQGIGQAKLSQSGLPSETEGSRPEAYTSPPMIWRKSGSPTPSQASNPISAISGAALNPTQDTPPTPETYSARVATPFSPLVRAMERAEEGYFPSSSKPGLTASDLPLTALARMLAEENKYTSYRNDLPLSQGIGQANVSQSGLPSETEGSRPEAYTPPPMIWRKASNPAPSSASNPISAISGAALNPTQDTPPTPETYSAGVATPFSPLVRAMERAEEGHFPSSFNSGLTASDSPLAALARVLAEENKYTSYRNDLPLSQGIGQANVSQSGLPSETEGGRPEAYTPPPMIWRKASNPSQASKVTPSVTEAWPTPERTSERFATPESNQPSLPAEAKQERFALSEPNSSNQPSLPAEAKQERFALSEPNRVFAQQVALPVVSADRTEATAQRFTSPEPNTTFSDNTILSASEVAAERFAAGSVVTRSYQATALTDPETVGYGSQLEPLSGQFIARSSLSSGGSSLAEFVATRQTAGEWAGQLAVSLQSNPGLASPANAISEPIPFEPIYAKPTKGQSKTSNEAALQRQNLEPKGVVAASLEAVSNQAATVALTQREANTRATSPTSRSAENQATLQAQLEAGLTNVKATEPISNEAVLQSQKLEPQAAAAQTQLEASVKATESISNEAVLQRQKLEPQAAASQIELQADLTTAKATKYNQFLPTGEGAWIPTSAPSRPLLSQFITPFGKKPLELAGMLYPSTWIEREVEEPASSQSWEAVPLLYRANPANKPEVSPENKMSASSVASTRTTSERIKVTGTESASDSFVVTPQSKAEQIATGTPSSSDSFAVTPQSKAEQSVKEKAGTPSNFGTSKTTPQAVNREQEVKPFDPQIQSGAVSSNALLRALERGQLPTVLARVLEQTELNSWLQSAGAEEAPTSVLSESASRKFAMPLLTLRKAKTYAPSPKPTSPDNWSEAEGSGFTPSSPLARSYQPSEPLMGRSEEQPVRQSSEPLVERSAEQPTERSSERILPNSTIGAQRGELGEFIVARRYFEDWAAQLPTLRTNLGLVQPSDSEPIGFEAAYVNYTKQAKNLSASKTSKEKGSAKPTTPISAAVQRAPALWDAALPVDPNKAALPADTNSQQVPPEVPKIFASSPGLSRSMTESAHSSSVKAEADGAIEVPPPAKPVYQTETDSLDAEGAWVPESSNPLVSRFGEPTNQDIGVMGMLHPATWIQRKASTSESAVRPVTPIGLPPLNTILRSAVGKPIENSVQTRMSQIFRKSFENVRVHTDEPAAGYAKEMGAEAFTVGQNIFFGAGRYQPETPLGQALLGHELTHVVQQTSLPSLGGGRIPETSTAGRAFEHEAINNESLILRHLSDNKASNSSYDSLTFPVERSFVPLEPLHLSNKVLQRSPDSSAVIERSTTGSSGSGDSSSSSTSVVAPTTEETKEKEALTKAEMNSIVREVYRLLKQQLLTDRERHGARGGLLL